MESPGQTKKKIILGIKWHKEIKLTEFIKVDYFLKRTTEFSHWDTLD